MRIKPSTPPYHGGLQQMRTVPGVKSSLAICIALAFTAAAPIAHAAQAAPPAVSIERAAPHWQSVATPANALTVGGSTRKVSLKLKHFHAATLDKNGMKGLTAGAPAERGLGDVPDTLTISLPHPDGGYQRFALVESPIMESGLAAKHPDIKTYRGKGIDDPTATLRMDITKLGLHASVRSPNGGWYVDPYYHLDDSLYASYHGRDLVNQHGPLVEAALGEAQLTLTRGFYKEGDNVEVRGLNFTPGASVNITVRSEGDTAVLQTVAATADNNGVVKLTLPAGGTGAFEVVASDGRATSTASYHVVDAAAAASATVGNQLRTYRLALVTDPTYASYFGGSANVTAAKVTLVNRVTQIYEDETSIRLVLIDGNDALNLDTDAQMTGANGPCGATACYTPSQASGCGSGTLTRNRIVTGLLVGASNFDIGHIGFGLDGGGIASLGVVGGSAKAQGCTGVPTPVGDLFAVDYVAHEIGHQFSGNHTFNGVNGSCTGGNRNDETSVEPGSGTSIMAYAGICTPADNVQPHSDPYWSQRSFDEIVAYTSSGESSLNEVQAAVLRNFTANGQQFQVSWNGSLSVPIVRGTNYTTAGIREAIQGIAGWPAGATVAVTSLTNGGFTVTFGGTLAGTNTAQLQLANFSSGVTGFTGEITAGGLTKRGGTVSSSGNTAPVVTAPSGYTIPVRTPFALTGSATDADGDTVTYLWEQNDRGGFNGTALLSNAKTNGPLFSQFGKRAIVTSADTIKYDSPGENHVTTDPTRVFPDIDQILANNTNAETGACPTPAATPTAANIECFAEYLPTPAYVGYGDNASPASLNFRVTARDGLGGVSSADTRLVLAPGAGPFLVTSQNAATTLQSGSTQTVTWNVANTNAAPVGVDNVKITLSTDGGKTWPYTLAASTPNDGSAPVTLPAVATTTARIKVEAIGNVFFDVSNANFKINLSGDVNADGVVDCADLGVIRSAFGKRTGQAGFDARADVVVDGVIDVRDLTYVARLLPQGTSCN